MIISSLLRFFREYGKSPIEIEILRTSAALERYENRRLDISNDEDEDNWIMEYYWLTNKIERVSARLAQLKEKRWRNNSSRT